MAEKTVIGTQPLDRAKLTFIENGLLPADVINQIMINANSANKKSLLAQIRH